jgi:ABC-type Fe3+-hydroxamate transport system substrate-binding protein
MIFIDQLHQKIELSDFPKRIISLVPSQTEFLCDIGVAEALVGITKFCIHPKEICKKIAKIGGTKNFLFDKIDSLAPDLIIANKEENYLEGVQKLQEKYPVWISDIVTLADNYAMMTALGEITNQPQTAKKIVTTIKNNFEKLVVNAAKKPKVIYLIWKQPFMAAGSNTFIDSMLAAAGFENLITTPRYPIIELAEMKVLTADFVFLSSEPYPFKEKHCIALEKQFENNQNMSMKKTKVICVDGELFSWYGSRLIHSVAYFEALQANIQAPDSN